MSVDLRLISELHSIWILVIQAAYPVDNASQYVRQVHYMRKIIRKKYLSAIADPEKYVVVQCAPAVRAGLGEAFGMPIGTDVEGKLAAALRRLGFDKVFDTTFSADLTIMEEAHEFLDRVQNGGVLPLITSCSPGWIKYCEHYFPDMTENLSSCKSPQQMFGATLKTYYAEKMGIDPKKIVSVSVMPCTAKKFEIGRDDEDAAGVPDVDIAITTRELARMIKKVGIMFTELPMKNSTAHLVNPQEQPLSSVQQAVLWKLL